MKNNNLAIAIPTYNRCDILKENLQQMMPDLKKYNIPVYISDDSSNDETRDMIIDLKNSYEHLYYYRNVPGLGHDKNCFNTLALPSEEYVWYLGDSMFIESGGIQEVLSLTERKEFDFIVTNSRNRGVGLNTNVFTDKMDVLSKLAWHLTLTGICIYRRKVIKEHVKIKKYKNFPQTSIVLNRILSTCNLFYVSNVTVSPHSQKSQSYWSDKVFDVFGTDWIDLITCIYNLDCSLKNKDEVIKTHSKKTSLLGVNQMINYRILGVLSISSYFKNRRNINLASHINKFVIFVILMSPRPFLSWGKFSYNQINKFCNKN